MFQKIKAAQKCKQYVLAGVGVLAGLAASTPAHATDIIDYSATATALSTSLGTAITAAVGVGVAILTARLGWGFFKKFTK